MFGCDNLPCNPNSSPGGTLRYIPNQDKSNSIQGDYEMDYTVEDTYPQKFLEVLINRYDRFETNYKKLERDENTNFFMYYIGHGGDEYFKLQDTSVIFFKEMENYLHDPANDLK